MTLRRRLTAKERSSKLSFEIAKNKLIAKKAADASSFMKLFQPEKNSPAIEDVETVLQFYLESLAPHLKSFKDIMTFLAVFARKDRANLKSVNTIILYTLNQCYALYKEPSQYRQVISKLIQANYPLLNKFEDFYDTQSTLEFVSRENAPDITPVETAIIHGKSIQNSPKLQLKYFPDDEAMKAEISPSISYIAQVNATITEKILQSCADEIKFRVSQRGKLSLMKFLHEYDKAYIHACDFLQSAHDEGRYLTARLAKLIYPTLTDQNEREAVLAEIPEAARAFYRKKFNRIKPYLAQDHKPNPDKLSLRLHERITMEVETPHDNNTMKHGSSH